MRQGKTATARLIQRARGFRYSLVWEGIAVGAAAGLVTVLFRLLLFLLGLLGVAVCLVFGRLLRKYTFREEP